MNNDIKDAIELAEYWNLETEKEVKRSESRLQKQFTKLAIDKVSKNIMIDLFDRSFRTVSNAKVVASFQYLLKSKGIPSFFSATEKLMVQLFIYFGHIFPGLSVFLLKLMIKINTSSVIIIGYSRLIKYITKRTKVRFSVNINPLGEIVLGDKEAKHHLNEYLTLIANPKIDYISIKVSNLTPHLHPLSYKYAYKILKERIGIIYQTVIDNAKKNDTKCSFVNLDMEEYKDLHLTIDVFKDTLSEIRFLGLKAGIVIQTYIPDSIEILKDLTDWAKKRVEQGGERIKVRIVKGANLQQEIVNSSIEGLACPIYETKLQVDANYKRVIEQAIQPESLKYVEVGVASHNMFDLAYAIVIAKKTNQLENITIEMLEGMSNPLSRVMLRQKINILLYAPYTEIKYFINALGYLIRRLDENTSKENFLRHCFGADLGSKEWEFLKKQFISAHLLKEELPSVPNRKQNRNLKPEVKENIDTRLDIFTNEPDTDFNLPQNIDWAENILNRYNKNKKDQIPDEIPLNIGGKIINTNDIQCYYDINLLPTKKLVYKMHWAGPKQVDEIFKLIKDDKTKWAEFSLEKRYKLLKKVAQKIREKRGDFIGIMAQITGKTFIEADVEISEGIDFIDYYPYSLYKIQKGQNLTFKGKGIVLVISPWNFPFAIPIGGIVAALSAGNSVIIKPSPEVGVIAAKFVELFWEAGIPYSALQIIHCKEGNILNNLVKHSAIKHIIFTGSTDTAKKIIKNNPKCPLSAETGGKNSTIITASADLDLAIKNVVHSAFSNGGQKCSATSILILEKELYESKEFKTKLIDCASSFKTGSAWYLPNNYGPLINTPNGDLLDAIIKNNDEEYWALKPEINKENNKIVTPGIKYGVKPGSYMHQNEFFGPILSVIKADNIKHAVKIANDVKYGLTSGIESLDEVEQEYWKQNIQAGNLYINRGTVGAIVQRQPFGGIKQSSFGCGLKAGGPSYAMQFANIKCLESSGYNEFEKINSNHWYINITDKYLNLFEPIILRYNSYRNWMSNYFNKEHDFSNIIGQDNILKFKTKLKMALRIENGDKNENILAASLAMVIANTDGVVSISKEVKGVFIEKIINFLTDCGITVSFQSDKKFVSTINQFNRIRLLSSNNDNLFYEAANKYIPIISHVPYNNGRIELVFYLQEQAISHNYHRYGNLVYRS